MLNETRALGSCERLSVRTGGTPQLPLTGGSGPAGAIIPGQKPLIRVSGLSASACSALVTDHIHRKTNRSRSVVSLSVREKKGQAKMNGGLKVSSGRTALGREDLKQLSAAGVGFV